MNTNSSSLLIFPFFLSIHCVLIVIMGVAGGAVFPSMMALTKDHKNIHLAFLIPLAGFIIELLYALFGSKWVKYVEEENDEHVDKENNSVELNKELATSDDKK